MRDLRYKIFIIMFIIASFLFGCVNNTISLPFELQDSVNKYYDHIIKKDWKVVYNYNINNFKKKVTFDQYKNFMEKNMKNWKLLDVQLFHFTKQADYYKIIVLYHAEFKGRETKIYKQTAWEKEDGRWKIFDAGTRLYSGFTDVDKTE